MGSNINHAIDLAIEKKLNSGYMLNNHGKELVKFARFNASKKCNYLKLGFSVETIIQENLTAKKDIYNNEFCNYFDQKIKKTQCKFNLLRLFKPGEILSSIAGS
jgi:hypothetical protein